MRPSYFAGTVARSPKFTMSSAPSVKASFQFIPVQRAARALPPSLPNYEELQNASKGYVADLVVDQLGDDCPDKELCKKLVQQGLDFMIAKIKEMSFLCQ